jgi:hypothetical protein
MAPPTSREICQRRAEGTETEVNESILKKKPAPPKKSKEVRSGRILCKASICGGAKKPAKGEREAHHEKGGRKKATKSESKKGESLSSADDLPRKPSPS